MSKSRVKGAASFRRLLKRMPDSAHNQMLGLLQKAGPSLVAQMKARIPVRTGRLQNSIGSTVTPATLKLKVGILSTKLGKSDLFYGHILDVGRRAGVYPVRRDGPRKGNKVRVPRMAPLLLVYHGLEDFRTQFLPDYRRLITAILTEAAGGGGGNDE